MKHALLGLVLATSAVFAGDIYGQIDKIDTQNHIITVSGMNVKVNPYTKIELDREWGWDTPLKFSDLKAGQFVKVDIIDSSYYNAQNGGMLIAEEIDVQDTANLAY